MPDFVPHAKLLKVLNHPVRLEILDILRDGEQCVCHLETFLGYRQSYISQHLTVLRSAGIIQDRRDGWNIFYRVIMPGIYDVIDAVSDLLSPEQSPERRPVLVNNPANDCPCPKCAVITVLPGEQPVAVSGSGGLIGKEA